MTPAKTIATEGASRQKVRVYLEGELIRVRWRENGKRMTRSWPHTRANKATAKAFAKGIAEGREIQTASAGPITLRQLWERFAEAEFPRLRPKTKKLYWEYFQHWETMWGREFIAEQTTLLMVVEFRAALTKQGKAISTIRHSVETVKMVYAWGALYKVMPTNEIALYKFKTAKEARKAPPPEYTDDEYLRIIAQLNPYKATEWRAWVALTICREQGVRQNSVLHLQWDDLDGDTIIWRARWDKTGREWTQPIRSGTRRALVMAMREDHDGPWVLPSGSRKNKGSCYTIGALYLALRGAEERAGVKHLKGRGGHGLRRLLAGDINRATGNPALAMMAIGDDVRQADKYIRRRDDEVVEAFAELDKPRTRNEATSRMSNRRAIRPRSGGLPPSYGMERTGIEPATSSDEEVDSRGETPLTPHHIESGTVIAHSGSPGSTKQIEQKRFCRHLGEPSPSQKSIAVEGVIACPKAARYRRVVLPRLRSYSAITPHHASTFQINRALLRDPSSFGE